MTVALAPEHEAFQRLCADVISEARSAMGWPERFGSVDDVSAQREFYGQLRARGWAAPAWPREHGGGGRTFQEHALFVEEIVRQRCPSPFNRVAFGIVSPAIMAFGSPEQKSTHLLSILSGTEVWCQGFSEPGAGSDLASLTTRATQDSTGDWTIQGQKVWTSLGNDADMCFLLARTGPERHAGITAFLLPMDQPGVRVRPIRQINGKSDFCEVFLDGAKVVQTGVLGAVGYGWKVAMYALSFERSLHLVHRIARLEQMLEDVRVMVRDSRMGFCFLESVSRASSVVASLRPSVMTQLRSIDMGTPAGVSANETKVRWSEIYIDVCRLGMDVAATLSGTERQELWVGRYLTSLGSSIYAGTNEVQRNIIAERGLELPRS